MWQRFQGIEVKVLGDRRELSGHSLQNFLSSQTTKERYHWSQVTLSLETKFHQQLLIDLHIQLLLSSKGLCRTNDDCGIFLVHWLWESAVLLSKSMQSLNSNVELLRAVELC